MLSGSFSCIIWPRVITTKSKKAKNFLKGLRADIFYQLAVMKPVTYVEALQNAQLAEELLTIHY